MNERIVQSSVFFDSSLFHDVQLSGLLGDSKVFADATPKRAIGAILADYDDREWHTEAELKAFVQDNFILPDPAWLNGPAKGKTASMQAYIAELWSSLTHLPSEQVGDASLLPLTHPYIVPGGRFREIYYWDSYFTALGLMGTGHAQIVVDMVENFFDLLAQIGHIPNGNRTYYIGRSQPPILALLVNLVLETPLLLEKDTREHFVVRAKRALEQEYAFWMHGKDATEEDACASERVVTVGESDWLNRYWDQSETPRAESYKEDVEHAQGLTEAQKPAFYRHIRAACESGWDFSSRWLADKDDLTSIRTTELIPVDLNCLLYNLENTLAALCGELSLAVESRSYHSAAIQRKDSILKYCWDDETGRFCDYDWVRRCSADVFSAAAFVPLFVGIATPEQAEKTYKLAQSTLFSQHGLHTTAVDSPQQWDQPNGWAPLQWFAVQGLLQYGFDKGAKDLAAGWCTAVEAYYAQSHQLMEKYDLRSPTQSASGGEYEVQHGFGWTNGVTVALKAFLSGG